MVKRKELFFSIVIICMLLGCAVNVPNRVKNTFTNRFDSKSSNIRSLIEIDGYYLTYNIERRCYGYGKSYSCYDTFDLNMIFYEDGTFVYNFFSKFESTNDIPSYLNKVISGENDSFYLGFYWGIYTLNGDTIKAQYMNRSAGMAPWICDELWFKVIDKKTLVNIFHKDLIDNYIVEIDNTNLTEAHFIPLDSIPIPNCWLKNESWIWSDINEYNNYMKKKE